MFFYDGTAFASNRFLSKGNIMKLHKFKWLGISAVLASALITNNATAGLIVDDNFDTLDTTTWTVEGGSVKGAPVAEFLSGNALHFDGNSTRSAVTSTLDLSTGGLLSFMLKIGGANDTSTFEQADGGEDILIEYSNDGELSWNNLKLIDTLDVMYSDVWGSVSIEMLSDAANATTQFRISQVDHSGTNYDNWAIDNVQISNFASVSEPSAFMILVLGLAGLVARRR